MEEALTALLWLPIMMFFLTIPMNTSSYLQCLMHIRVKNIHKLITSIISEWSPLGHNWGIPILWDMMSGLFISSPSPQINTSTIFFEMAHHCKQGWAIRCYLSGARQRHFTFLRLLHNVPMLTWFLTFQIILAFHYCSCSISLVDFTVYVFP